MNSCTFAGRLGKDPELRSTNSGTPVCNFSLAVNQIGKDEALWLDVSVWGKAGENAARFLSKGREAVVSGRISPREYERRDGTTGFAIELNANDVTFVGGRDEGGQGGGGSRPQAAAPAPSGGGRYDDDDIPF